MTNSPPISMSPLISEQEISEQDAELGISENELEKELDKIKRSLPTPINKREVNFRLDNSNDPAIYVDLTVDDEVIYEKIRFSRRRKIRTIVRNLIGEKINYKRFVYVHFHMSSDFLEE